MLDRFFNEVEPFVNQYCITVREDIALRSPVPVSGDVFEDTLLRLAGVNTKPKSCVFVRYDGDKLLFEIEGLAPQDITAFAHFLKLSPETVKRKQGDIVEFIVSGQTVYQELFPKFKNEIANLMANSPRKLKPYIHPQIALKALAYPMEEMLLLLAQKANEDNFKEPKAKFSEIVQYLKSGLDFMKGADRVFKTVMHEPFQDSYQDLLEYRQKYPQVDANPEMKEALTKLISCVNWFVVAVTPEGAKNVCDQFKDVKGNRIRFFDRSVTDNLLRALDMSDQENAEDDKMLQITL